MYTYILLFIVTVFFSYHSAFNGIIRQRNNNTISYSRISLGAFLIMLIFIGLRNGVGRDYPAYYSDFFYTDLYDFGSSISKYKYEYGFYAIVYISRFLRLGPQMIFIISAIITLFLFFRLFRKYYEYLPCAILIFFIALPYGFIINGLRQGIAIFLFLNAIEYLEKDENIVKDIICYIFWILLASLFHTSAVFLISLVLFKLERVKKMFNSIVLCLIAISGLLFNMFGLGDFVLPTIDTGGGYSYGAMMESEMFVVQSEGLSIGKLLSLIVYLVPLLYYNKIKQIYPSFSIYFIMLSIGSLIFFMFPNNMLTIRVSYYFLFSELYVFPILQKYLINHSKIPINRIIWIFVLFAFLLIQIREFNDFYKLQIWNNASIYGISIK